MTDAIQHVRTTKKPHLTARLVTTVSVARAYHPGSSDNHSPRALPVAACASSTPGSGITGAATATSSTRIATR